MQHHKKVLLFPPHQCERVSCFIRGYSAYLGDPEECIVFLKQLELGHEVKKLNYVSTSLCVNTAWPSLTRKPYLSVAFRVLMEMRSCLFPLLALMLWVLIRYWVDNHCAPDIHSSIISSCNKTVYLAFVGLKISLSSLTGQKMEGHFFKLGISPFAHLSPPLLCALLSFF